MANRRISHARGRGSLNHNNRNHIYKNIDPTKTENNIYYAKESLEDAYQKCFGEALANYNAKQKRADRKIDDYYKHLFGNANKDTVATSSNKEKSFYEIVVGIGDKNTCAVGSPDGELAAKILDEYAKGFSERNQNFYVFNSVMHLDEKTPHLHIDYIPIATGYKSSLETRNSQSVALEQMGFGKNKNSINEWRIQERQILRQLCQAHGLEIAEETQGRGKTFRPDEYKKIRDEVKEEMKTDPDILDDVRAEVEAVLLSEQQHLIDENSKHRQEALELMETKDTLIDEIKQTQGKVQAEKDKLKAEQKNFSDMQSQFKPRKDDLDRVNQLSRETKPSTLTSKYSVTKADWDFLIGIAKQHAKISDTTLAALEKHTEDTEELKICQTLYLTLATEVIALGYGDRSKLKHRAQDVLKGVDSRVVSWLVDDLIDRKPSSLDEIIERREATIQKKLNFANKVRGYNQPTKTVQPTTPAPQKIKKKSQSQER
ncbi:MAG: plasmid recombination protein [Firmicutes bacterium]|nr:plasmid recombination protein [Bacillota bacterium]